MDKVFGYFDGLFVINLDHDTDRLARMTRRLARLGLTFERYSAIPACERLTAVADGRLKPGHFACGRSHQALMRHAWEAGYENVLICEDDAVFRDDIASRMSRIVPELMKVPWDVLYLGSHIVRSTPMASEHMIRVLEGYHTHAYAVGRKAMPRLMRHIEAAIEIGRAFDGFEDPELLKLCASPILAIQEPNHSYTLGHFVDRLSQYFGAFDRSEFEANCSEMRTWIRSSGEQPSFPC